MESQQEINAKYEEMIALSKDSQERYADLFGRTHELVVAIG